MRVLIESSVITHFRQDDAMPISGVYHLLSILSPHLWLSVLICKKRNPNT